MAFPVILVDSTDGAASDSAASGAGPSTALTGSAASTSGDGLTVTLDGSPDLSGVATDGSAVIYLADTTAGNRNFGRITGTDDGADTVTVDTAFGTSLSGLSWAIGGVRATVLGAVSRKLIENNSAAGDAMPGWTVRMKSGHTESTATTVTLRRTGDVTGGPITLEGDSAAATMPVLTWTANVVGIASASSILGWHFRHFDMRNSNATKTNSIAIEGAFAGGGRFVFAGMRIAHAVDSWHQAISSPGDSRMIGCEIGHTADEGVFFSDLLMVGCYIHDTADQGVVPLSNSSLVMYGCIIKDAGSVGVQMNGGRLVAVGNSIYSCTGDAIDFTSTPVGSFIANNLFVSNGGFGIDVNGTVPAWANTSNTVYNNGFFNNTSGKYDPSDLPSVDEVVLTGDPFTDAANGDFSLNNTAGAGAAAKAAGVPSEFPGVQTTSFTDIGAAQAECTGGVGGSVLRPLGMSGGLG